MANQPSINVSEIIKTIDPHNLIKHMKLPQQDVMTYEELIAWYRTRRRNHRAIKIFFNLLAVLLTGPLFHFIWGIIYRAKNYHHIDWLMRNTWYYKAEILLNAIEEKLNQTKKQYEEYLLDDSIQNYEGSSDEQSVTSSLSDKIDEPPQSPITQTTPIDPRYLCSPINIDNPESIKQIVLHDHDLATLWIAMLDDKTLIRTFIRPELTVRLRQLALYQLFSRTSESATNYFKHYLSFYLSRDLIKEQLLTADQIARFSVIHTADMDTFVLAQTVRVKLGHENSVHISRLLKSPFIIIKSKSKKLLCETALNDTGMDIPFLMTHNYSDLVVTDPDCIFYAIGGDISKLAPCYHESIINALSVDSHFYRLALDRWDLNLQKLLTNRILYLCNDLNSTCPKTFLQKFPIDQLDDTLLDKFVSDLLIRISIRSNQTFRSNMHALCQVLKNTDNNKITQVITESLLNSLMAMTKNKHLEQEHWTVPLISALCCVKYHHLSDEFKEKFIAQAHKIYKKIPTKPLALYLLSNLDYDDMSDKEENSLVNKCLHQKSHSQIIELMSNIHFHTLTIDNQIKISYKFLIFFRAYLEHRIQPPQFSDETQSKLISLIQSIINKNQESEIQDRGIWVALLPIFTMDFRSVDSKHLYQAISMIQNTCTDTNESTHYLLRFVILSVAHLIQLSLEEQSSFLDYLYALSHESEYLEHTLNGLHIIKTSHLDDPSFEHFLDWFSKLVNKPLELKFIEAVVFPCIRVLFNQLDTRRKSVFFDTCRDYIEDLFNKSPNNTFHFLSSLSTQDTALEDFLINTVMKCINRQHTEQKVKISAQNIYFFILKLPIQIQHSIKDILFAKLEQNDSPHLGCFNILALMRRSSLLTTEESEMLNKLFVREANKSKYLRLLPLFWNNRVTEDQKSTLSKIADNSYLSTTDLNSQEALTKKSSDMALDDDRSSFAQYDTSIDSDMTSSLSF